jgi:hypothetical protein
VNDDTKLVLEWAKEAVQGVRGFSPPLLGVVGPDCPDGNTAILTHDFVHRQHLEIFPTYYPPILTDYYLDDWISKVYGEVNTQRGPFKVAHTEASGTRYEPNSAHKTFLGLELHKGGKFVQKWMIAHGMVPTACRGCSCAPRPGFVGQTYCNRESAGGKVTSVPCCKACDDVPGGEYGGMCVKETSLKSVGTEGDVGPVHFEGFAYMDPATRTAFLAKS